MCNLNFSSLIATQMKTLLIMILLSQHPAQMTKMKKTSLVLEGMEKLKPIIHKFMWLK